MTSETRNSSCLTLVLEAGHVRGAAVEGILHVLSGYQQEAVSPAGLSAEKRCQYEHLRMVSAGLGFRVQVKHGHQGVKQAWNPFSIGCN